jgi:hypothetical protein
MEKKSPEEIKREIIKKELEGIILKQQQEELKKEYQKQLKLKEEEKKRKEKEEIEKKELEKKIQEMKNKIEKQKEIINDLKRKRQEGKEEDTPTKKEKKTEKTEKVKINIKKNNDVILYSVNKNTILKKLFLIYNKKNKLPTETKYLYRGIKIDENKTVEDLDFDKELYEIEVETQENDSINDNIELRGEVGMNPLEFISMINTRMNEMNDSDESDEMF